MNSLNYLTDYEVLKDLKSSLDSKVKLYLYNPEQNAFITEIFSINYSIPSYYVKDCDKVVKVINNLKRDYEKYLSFLSEIHDDFFYKQKKAMIDDEIKLIKVKDGNYSKFLLTLSNLPKEMIEKNLKGIFQIHNSYHDFLRYHLDYPFSKIVIKDEKYLNYKYFYVDKFTDEDYSKLISFKSLAINAVFDNSIKISFYDGKEYAEFSTKARNDEKFFEDILAYYNKINPFFIYTYNFSLFYQSLNLNEANMLRLGINNENLKYYGKSQNLKLYLIPGKVDIDLWLMKNILSFDIFEKFDSLDEKNKTIAIYNSSEEIKQELIYLSKLYNMLPNELAFHGAKRRVSDFFMKQGYFKKYYPKVKPYNDYALGNNSKEPLLFRDFDHNQYLQKLRNKPIIYKGGLFYADVVNFYPLQNVFKDLISLENKKFQNKEVVRRELEHIASYPFFLFLFDSEKAKKEFDLKIKEKINQKDYVEFYLTMLKNKINNLEGIINFNDEEFVFENFYKIVKDPLENNDFLPKYSALVLSFDRSKYVIANENKLTFRGFNLNNKTQYEQEMIISFLEDLMIKRDFLKAFSNLEFKIRNIYNTDNIQQLYYKKAIDKDQLENFLKENFFILEDYKVEEKDKLIVSYLLKKEEFIKQFYSSANILNKILKALNIESMDLLSNRKYIKSIVNDLYENIVKSEKLELF
ncbi:MAG: hypothetical protein QXR30_03265 [Candidatus Woesearchaeota archaeon]